MVAEKARYEFACVLPGITSSTIVDDQIYVNEPRLVVALDMFNCKIRGIKLQYIATVTELTGKTFRNSKIDANLCNPAGR